MNKSFVDSGLDRKIFCTICTDGAPAMLGCRTGFQTRVKAQVSDVMSLHCMIHKLALASKTLPPLSNVVSKVIKLVNCIKRSELNACLFRELYKFYTSSENIPFHTEVRWLSRCNVFIDYLNYTQKFKCLFTRKIHTCYFNIILRSFKLAYLVDIFFFY